MAKIPRIPGLTYVPVDDEEDESNTITCMGFNLREFKIRGRHTYGANRRLTEFAKIKTISAGRYGVVYKVRDSADNQVYALKKLVLPDCHPDHPKPMPQSHLREINNLKTLKHINIINLKEVVVGKSIDSNYLLLDYCEYSLKDVIECVDQVFFQHQHIKNVMLQILSGLEYLHSFDIIHRDLCPRNILFDETGVLKISDFGSSRAESDGDMTPDQGVMWYRAPELLFGSRKYTKAVDIWSVGCILGEMIRQRPLLRGANEGDVIRSVIDLLGSPTERHWPGFSELPVPRHFHLRKQPYNRMRPVFYNQTLATVNYIQRFLKYNPATRPSAEALMHDQYYGEHPLSCADHALMVPLRLSKRLNQPPY